MIQEIEADIEIEEKIEIELITEKEEKEVIIKIDIQKEIIEMIQGRLQDVEITTKVQEEILKI